MAVCSSVSPEEARSAAERTEADQRQQEREIRRHCRCVCTRNMEYERLLCSPGRVGCTGERVHPALQRGCHDVPD